MSARRFSIITLVLSAVLCSHVYAQASENGPVRAWGLNDYGQCTIPTDLGNCSAIAVGERQDRHRPRSVARAHFVQANDESAAIYHSA